MGGTCTYSAQYTVGNVYSIASDTLKFYDIPTMSAATGDSTGITNEGSTGVRIQVVSHTSGTLAINYSQART